MKHLPTTVPDYVDANPQVDMSTLVSSVKFFVGAILAIGQTAVLYFALTVELDFVRTFPPEDRITATLAPFSVLIATILLVEFTIPFLVFRAIRFSRWMTAYLMLFLSTLFAVWALDPFHTWFIYGDLGSDFLAAWRGTIGC